MGNVLGDTNAYLLVHNGSMRLGHLGLNARRSHTSRNQQIIWLECLIRRTPPPTFSEVSGPEIVVSERMSLKAFTLNC